MIKNNIDMSEISGSYNVIGSSANPFKGSVSGQDFTGALVGGIIGGVLTGTNDFAYVFSAGSITGTSTHVGQLHGTDSGFTLTQAYIDEDAVCSGCVHTRGTNIDTGSNPNYFFTQTNAPLSAWDFDMIWLEDTGTFPVLRN